jgi:glycosyltransferase involved in cell wall biosynthesis
VRILYIVTAFPRDSGDVITPWLTETISRLRDRRIDVEVLAPSYRGLGGQVVDGTRVHRFRYAPAPLERLTHDQTVPDLLRERPLYAGLLPGYLLAGSLSAARIARSGGFDVVHAFWPLPHGLFGLAARQYAGLPLVSTFFGVELTWVRSQLPFLRPLLRTIVRRSDAVTAISSHTAEEIRQLDMSAGVVTIPFGAAHTDDTENHRGPRDAKDAGTYELLFVGRLVERKGVDFLIRAVAGLRGERSVRLTIVGEGPERPRLEALVEELRVADSVSFAGSVRADELGKLYRTSDAFVLPAVRDSKGDVEGLGVVLIEALMHGLPVVASRSGGIPDIVIDGDTGLLVPPGDVLALAGALGRLMDDPGLARRLASHGAEHVDHHFSWERIIDDLENLYRRVAGEAGSRPRSLVRSDRD